MDVITKGEKYFKKALVLFKKARFSNAKRLFQIAATANYSPSICFLHIGIIQLLEMETSEAFKTFQMILAGSDNLGEIYFYMGEIFQAFDNKNESLSNYKKAIFSSKNEISRLKAYEKIKDFLSPLEKKAFKKKAFNAYLIRNNIPLDEEKLREAIIFRLKGEYESAIEVLNETISLYPSYYAPYQELAKTYIEMKKYHLAYNVLKKIKQIFKKERLVLKDLAKMSFLLRRYKESATCTRKLIRLNPKNHKLYVNLATSLALIDKHNEAIKYYKKSIELKSDFFSSYYNIGAIYQKNGFLEESLSYYKQALMLNPDYAPLNYNLALIHFEVQEYFEALYYFSKAHKLDPDFKEASENFEVIGNLKIVENNTLKPLELSLTSKVSLGFSLLMLVLTFFYLFKWI